MLQCFIADEEMFDGDDRYARNELKEWLDKHGEKGGGSSPRSIAASPRSPKKAKGGEAKESEGREAFAVETGT